MPVYSHTPALSAAAMTCAVAALLSAASAGIRIHERIELDGNVKAGASYVDKGNQRYSVHDENIVYVLKGQIDLTVLIGKRFEVSLDMRGDIDKPGVVLRKAWLGWNFGRYSRARIGSMKKDFSIEEMLSSHDLFTVRRSLVHRHIESFHILGYDFTAQYRFRRERQYAETVVSVNAGGNAAPLGFLNVHIAAERLWGTLLAYELGVVQRYGSSYAITGLGFVTPFDRFRLEVELFGGNDPRATELLEDIGEPRIVCFGAARGLAAYAHPLDFGLMKGLEPVVAWALLFPDVEESPRPELEIAVGLHLLLVEDRDIVWKNVFEVVFSNNLPGQALVRKSYALHSQVQVEW